jgi:glycosyltransferase involved in cell wall biosynthesis
MRLLLISNFFPPTQTAGTEKRTYAYASRLLSRGHGVQVVCAGLWSEGPRYFTGCTDEIYGQIPVHRVHLNWTRAPDPNRFLYRNPVLGEHIQKFMAQWEPDVVHVTSCVTMSATMIEAAKKQRLPVVLTLTDFWFLCPRITLLQGNGSLCDGRKTGWDCLRCMLWNAKAYRWLRAVFPEWLAEKALTYASRKTFLNRRRGLRGMALNMEERASYLSRMLHAADVVTAPSEHMARITRESGVLKPVRVIRSGHDVAWLKNMPEKRPSARVRFGYVGQIIPIKGVDILISAFLSSSLAGRAELVLYGDQSADPDFMWRLEAMIGGDEKNVVFRGIVPHDRLGEVFSNVDAVVVPSRWHENNPRIIQESFASRTPVIASNVGGISEFVQDGKNGLLFERDDARDLGRQLRRVADSPELLEKLRKGIAPVKTIEEEIDELEGIYRDLVSRKHVPA